MATALVTGASRGIGFAITEKLFEDGFKVIGTAYSSDFSDQWTEGENFTGIHADLSDHQKLKEILKPVVQSECPDVLINNAGISLPADFTVSDENWLNVWESTMRVNLRASALLCKWFINSHLENGSEGVIINIASRAAYRGDTQQYAAYAASKGGMVAFTKSIARDFGKNGIVAYSIAPGFIDTDMARESVDVYGEEYLLKDSAFGEITKPGEVANLVSFLASGKAKHATGSTFHINGGSYMI